MAKEYYEITIAGCKRKLQICRIGEDASIAGLVLLGDVELICAAAKALVEKAPDFDYILAPECKSIPVAHEMAKLAGKNYYIVARKNQKAYMKDFFKVNLTSITTAGEQSLYLDSSDAEKMKGKRILIVDDVVSTGESLKALEMLVEKAEGIVSGKMFILAEGKAADRDDICYLEKLPLFDGEGNPSV